jgi:hypothetical protein
MSGYVRETKFSIEFEGDTVSGSLAPLKFPDLLRLESKDVKNDQEAAAVLAEIAPQYVKSFVGPKDAAGVEVPLQEVFESAYFIDISMGIGRRLINAAKIGNPKKPSEPSAT